MYPFSLVAPMIALCFGHNSLAPSVGSILLALKWPPIILTYFPFWYLSSFSHIALVSLIGSRFVDSNSLVGVVFLWFGYIVGGFVPVVTIMFRMWEVLSLRSTSLRKLMAQNIEYWDTGIKSQFPYTITYKCAKKPRFHTLDDIEVVCSVLYLISPITTLTKAYSMRLRKTKTVQDDMNMSIAYNGGKPIYTLMALWLCCYLYIWYWRKWFLAISLLCWYGQKWGNSKSNSCWNCFRLDPEGNPWHDNNQTCRNVRMEEEVTQMTSEFEYNF